MSGDKDSIRAVCRSYYGERLNESELDDLSSLLDHLFFVNRTNSKDITETSVKEMIELINKVYKKGVN